MKRKGRGFPLEYYPGETLTETEARKNRKLVIVSVKKKVVAGVIVVYFVVKIFTGPNKIEGQSQTTTPTIVSKTLQIRTNQNKSEQIRTNQNKSEQIRTNQSR